MAGFEAFTPLFAAVVLAAAGVVLGFVALDRARRLPRRALVLRAAGGRDRGRPRHAAPSRAPVSCVQGLWWRTFGLVVLANLAVAIPGLLLLAPFTAIAESTDRAVWELVGSIVATSITAPFVALYSTLLYYDLVARAESPYAGGGHGGPESPAAEALTRRPGPRDRRRPGAGRRRRPSSGSRRTGPGRTRPPSPGSSRRRPSPGSRGGRRRTGSARTRSSSRPATSRRRTRPRPCPT